LKKLLSILFFLYVLSVNLTIAQVIEERHPDDFDTLLLSPECRLDRDQLGKIFTKLEIYAEFPGGYQKWYDFVKTNFDFESVARLLGDTVTLFQDSIIVKFIVTRYGGVCNIQYIAGNPILTIPMTKLLRISPNWKPGLNGGRQLHSYRTLQIDFIIDRKLKKCGVKYYSNAYLRDYD
jgi:hypothetical protein